MKRIDNYDLSIHNTFGMKVKCACFIEYDSVKELEALDLASLPQPVMHIGAGSNLLFTKDFPGTVLHSNVTYVKYVDMGMEELFVAAGAGKVFDDLVAELCGHGLWGAENLSLIPGEVGAAAVQNIGAYGVEVKDIISGVVCLDTLTGQKVKFRVEDCAYGYRSSMFKQEINKGRYIVTSVLFRLTRKYSPKLEYRGVRAALGGKDPKTPMEVREAIIDVRRKKLPDPKETGSAGSFFKNPVISAEHFGQIEEQYRAEQGPDSVVPHYDAEGGMIKIPAAWMIEQCGFKGMTHKGAAVYQNQPLVIVNATGDASPEDIIELEERIIEGVKTRFGVVLSPEVEHI